MPLTHTALPAGGLWATWRYTPVPRCHPWAVTGPEQADGERPSAVPPASVRGARNRYVDLLRLLAIVVVVVGHWLDTIIVTEGGRLEGRSVLAVVGYARWLTIPFQVMPLFFVAGGYAAAASWPTWRARGGTWAGWTHGRLQRLLRPTGWFLASMAAAVVLGNRLGLDPGVLAQAGWAVALQLWFLPVYMLLLLLAVPLTRAWERAGWWVLVLPVAVVAGVDILLRMGRGTVVGWADYLVGWGVCFVLGIAWRHGALGARAIRVGLLVGGSLALVLLVTVLGYPPWMIGIPGEPVSNTAPPNLALLAFSAAQLGVVLLCEAPLQGWLERPRVWAAVVRGNLVVMTLYLWHMVPVLAVAALAQVVHLPSGPAAGTLSWWGYRIAWVGVLALLLLGLVRVVGRFELPRPGHPGLRGWWPSMLLVACALLCGYALFRLAQAGFAPAGRLAVGPLAIFVVGMLALWAAVRASPRHP